MNTNNQKGFANIVLIAVIVILVGAVGYFAFVKKSEPVVQQLTPTPKDETANWKTYSSVDFSLKYPATWYLETSSPGFINITNYDSSVIPGSEAPISPENISINISMYPPGKYNNFSANETLESWVGKIGLSDKQNILVDGIKAIRGRIIYTGEEESRYYKKGESSGDYVLVIVNSKGYQISYSPHDSKFISTFNQILSTFKFTN